MRVQPISDEQAAAIAGWRYEFPYEWYDTSADPRRVDLFANPARRTHLRAVVDDDGELVGYLHVKDVLQADPHGRARVVEDKWIRPFATVRVGDSLTAALQLLQEKGAHMARVVDVTGRVVGVATLEDVLEELVGEIRDAAHAEGH